MSNTTNMICNDGCDLSINIKEIEKVYDALSTKIYIDMDKQYKEGKISGPKYADTWKDIMATVINNAISGVVALQSKETTADRAVKYEDIDSSQAKTTRDDELADKSMEVSDADISLKTEQEAEIGKKSLREECLSESECELKEAQEQEVKVKYTQLNESFKAVGPKTLGYNWGYKTIDEYDYVILIEEHDDEGKMDYENAKLIAEADLIGAKEKAEDIKNGDDAGVGSLYAQNILTASAQEALYERQKTGFSDNARQKVLDSQLSAWSVAYNNLESWTLPLSVQDTAIDDAVTAVNAGMGTD